jgi:hypothetical protein
VNRWGPRLLRSRDSAPRTAARAPGQASGPTRRYCDGTAPLLHTASASCGETWNEDPTQGAAHVRGRADLRVRLGEGSDVGLASNHVGELVAVRNVVHLDRMPLRRHVARPHSITLVANIGAHRGSRWQRKLHTRRQVGVSPVARACHGSVMQCVPCPLGHG